MQGWDPADDTARPGWGTWTRTKNRLHQTQERCQLRHTPLRLSGRGGIRTRKSTEFEAAAYAVLLLARTLLRLC